MIDPEDLKKDPQKPARLPHEIAGSILKAKVWTAGDREITYETYLFEQGNHMRQLGDAPGMVAALRRFGMEGTIPRADARALEEDELSALLKDIVRGNNPTDDDQRDLLAKQI